MKDYIINNINFEAINGAEMDESGKRVLGPICEDIQRNPGLWEMFRRIKMGEFYPYISDSWFDELAEIEAKYNISILLPISWGE